MNPNIVHLFRNYSAPVVHDEHCGPGSSMWYTKNIRKNLSNFFQKHKINSILDAPCGDFQWMSSIKFSDGFEYKGADITKNLIDRNNSLYGNMFYHLDITEDDLPNAQCIFVRDCLFHLKNEYKIKFFKNFLRNKFDFILTTMHPYCKENKEIKENTIDYEQINWLIYPWDFPKPLDIIEDYGDSKDIRFLQYPYRVMALWERKDIEKIDFDNIN